MSIPTEAERRAKYHADMAATTAKHGRTPTNQRGGPYQGPGAGAIQTADSARRIHEMAQSKAAAAGISKLTPAQIIKADYRGRTEARERAAHTGQTLSDADLQRAGRAGVQRRADLE
jgi:hypothetical protein